MTSRRFDRTRNMSHLHGKARVPNNDDLNQPSCNRLCDLKTSINAFFATTMNWTGGNLQRTKHANKGIVQKQRAYFASARAQLQNSSRSPVALFRPSYFRKDEDCDLGGQVPLFELGSVRRTGHPARQIREQVGHKASPQNKRHYRDNGERYQAASKRVSQHAISGPGSPMGAVRGEQGKLA